MHATLIASAIRWQRISISPLEREQLMLLNQELRITRAEEMEEAAYAGAQKESAPWNTFAGVSGLAVRQDR